MVSLAHLDWLKEQGKKNNWSQKGDSLVGKLNITKPRVKKTSGTPENDMVIK